MTLNYVDEGCPEALKGLRVIDAANVIAGPYCAGLLAEFGAEVIKVEQPVKGDNFRAMGPRSKDGKSIRWASMGRNKKTITLDFHYEEARQIFLDLVRDADVVIENYRTGTFEKWGLGFEELKKVNPKIILTHVTGYGQTGPNKEMSGFGGPLTGFSGITYCIGYPDRPPVNPSFSLADYVGGLNAAVGTMIALYHRDVLNGEGQEVDVSLYEGLFRMQDAMIANYSVNKVIAERKPRMDGASVPGGTFETRDKKWMRLASSTDNAFKYLCEAMERPDMIENFPTMKDRFAAETYIMEETTKWFASHDAKDIAQKAKATKAVITPIYSIEDIFMDEQYQYRQDIIEVDDPDVGRVAIPNVCPRLSGTPGRIKWPGRPVGDSNKEIYKNLLKMDDKRLEELKKKGVI